MVRRTKEEAQATRSALLDAAEYVFLKRGVSRTSLAEIAKYAGVTRGAVYWHFKDKADLFSAMMERVTSPLVTELEAVLASLEQGEDLVMRLRQHIRRAMHCLVHDPQTQRVIEIALLLVELVDDLGPLRAHRTKTNQHKIQCVAAVLSKASEQRGTALPTSAEMAANGLHSLITGLVCDWLLEHSYDLEHTALTLVDMYLCGMGLAPFPDKG